MDWLAGPVSDDMIMAYQTSQSERGGRRDGPLC